MSQNIPRPEYPRPQFTRQEWVNLNGQQWTCEFDFGKTGLERGLQNSKGFSTPINVPFCPESTLSGVGYTDFIEAMFYHRTLEIPASWAGKLILLHFGAVDYECELFLDGKSVGTHLGGSVSFNFDITDYVKPGKTHDLVLYVKDDRRSGWQPSGKQSAPWKSSGCSYTRTTGIWQTVWMEPVSRSGISSCRINPDLDRKSFVFRPCFFRDTMGSQLTIRVLAEGKLAGSVTVPANSGISVEVPLDIVHPWTTEDPFLYDVEYFLTDASGCRIDTVNAYAGLRKIHLENGMFYLNNEPVYLRFVLDQGFYPDGIWTAPSDEALKNDIQLSMAAGFNGARLHQKVFEERFHYWADRLGYLTWGESASWGLNCFCNPTDADITVWKGIFNFLSEWKAILERDYNHPSIIAWTPANETWIGYEPNTFRKIITEIYDVTKAIDPSRPCNECSGYHHVKTDTWTVHYYAKNAEDLKKGLNPEDKPVYMKEGEIGYHGQPYIADEIGGFLFISPERQNFADNTWGYHGLNFKDEDSYCQKIEEQIKVLLEMPNMAGFCYTQLTDVEQEQNGVYYYDRSPKVTAGKLAAIFGQIPERSKR